MDMAAWVTCCALAGITLAACGATQQPQHGRLAPERSQKVFRAHFDRASAVAQMRRAAWRAAANCVGTPAHPVQATVTVPFLNSGRPDYSNISVDGSGIPESGWQRFCIMREFLRIQVPPFDGDTVVLSQAVEVR
jgi:hypothetical protein